MITALIVFFSLLLVVWLLLPFWLRPDPAFDGAPVEISPRQRLNDLEFDHATGKIDEEDYTHLKAAAQQEKKPVKAPVRPAAPQAEYSQIESSQVRQAEALAEAEIAIASAKLRLKQKSSEQVVTPAPVES